MKKDLSVAMKNHLSIAIKNAYQLCKGQPIIIEWQLIEGVFYGN
jgi:hypothetical protein